MFLSLNQSAVGKQRHMKGQREGEREETNAFALNGEKEEEEEERKSRREK